MTKKQFFYGLVLSLAVWCVLIEPRWVAKREFNAHLPDSKPLGLKVIVTSDWHLTKKPLWRVMTTARAMDIVQDINAIKPDVILIAGDLIAEENQKPLLANTVEDEVAFVLGKLHAKHGVYAVLGNHDNWYDNAKMKVALEKQNIHVLENEADLIAAKQLWIVGVGDESTGHAAIDLAVKNLPSNAKALVMMHDPGTFASIPKLNALFIAGHTHGGQVYLPWIGALIVPYAAPREWAYGWIRFHQNLMYVTSGLGVSILPIRFNMRPEWVLLNI